jgi:23S rRNA (adenine2503-C2)-methyltransferase
VNNILDYNLNELKLWMKENGEKEFRAKQTLDWIYNGVSNFNEMKNLPQATKKNLEESFYADIPIVVDKLVSSIDNTQKFLFSYRDGNLIESVVMRYNHGYSICVSTQVGCRMGCRFCASTIGGMVRNLTSGEILAQILAAQYHIKERISNVVLMGSGEPLDNFNSVVKFINEVNASYGLNIGQRHITLSTCGIVPKMKELADKDYQITLAVSLHAASDDKRKKIMPIANKYSIVDILDACKYYINKTGRRITFEYALVESVNDNEEDAAELVKLLKGLLCHVNLIPVNEVKESVYKRSANNRVKRFNEMLINGGIEATIRREMGSDINAACGQLRQNHING